LRTSRFSIRRRFNSGEKPRSGSVLNAQFEQAGPLASLGKMQKSERLSSARLAPSRPPPAPISLRFPGRSLFSVVAISGEPGLSLELYSPASIVAPLPQS
jgi:hypothetical protein